MAKKGKRSRGRKPTKGDAPSKVVDIGARRVSREEAALLAAADQRRQAEEFERRKRHQLAKAAIELDPIDVLILEHQILRPWLTQEQIGDLVGLGRQAVNERINAAKFQRAIGEAARSALEIFESNKARAARKLGKLLESPDDRVAIRAAIAHMWPHIHADTDGKSGQDWIAFLQEAAELADSQKPADAPAEKTTGA